MNLGLDEYSTDDELDLRSKFFVALPSFEFVANQYVLKVWRAGITMVISLSISWTARSRHFSLSHFGATFKPRVAGRRSVVMESNTLPNTW